ncbi:S41 family peptidase [Sporosarcina sp. JAI121]|uniref:S41 family peptidase n=1 Tax=Sporosarcina sp. JAI121 TaxID=2723064 RepID=UPI0015C8D28F|nr:S41 family peptidase [Sporosarcina sp. JAI121]NYF23542.1 carboxyl-terminal processing protease [Sporosarcina sp. JAI121]
MKKLQTAFITFIALFLFAPFAQAGTVDDVKFFVETYYYGDIPKNLHTMKTVDEIINSLDEYSRYLSADEYRTYIAAVAEDTQQPTTKLANTPKASLILHPITSSMLYGNIGYIKIDTFSADLGKQVETHWSKLKKAGATGLIVDLRFNGGGYVDSAEQLLGFYQGVTDAYYLKTREGNKMIKPVPTKTKFPKQSYVLVNRYSASASEIVAASLKDQQAATIVGETTKGKGTVQSFFEFDNGGALKLTIGQFTGPKGAVVHKKGVEPAIKMEPNKELVTIHQRILNETLSKKQYKKLNTLQNVPTNKTFDVEFTQPMNFKDAQASNTIELVKAGGVAVPVTVKQKTDNTLEVIPKKQLQLGGTYTLVINPGMKNTNSRTVKQGTFVPITVQTAK